MNPQRPLAEWVNSPEPSPAAVQLEWHEVRRRVQRRKQMRVGLAVLSLLLVALVAGLALRPGAESFVPGQTVVTTASARTLRLAEGSTVVVADASNVSLQTAEPTEVLLVLDHGRASFDVAKNPARRFIVKADDVEVRVVGTRFTVQRDGRAVSVSVERGIVEVREGETVRRLERGASWSRAANPVAVEEPGDEESADEGDELAADEVDATDTVDTVEPPGVPSRTTPAQPTKKKPHHRSKKKTVKADAPPAVAPGGSGLDEPLAKDPLPPQPTRLDAVESTPADTFQAAMRARADGKAKDAIAGFQLVCERWPSSAYAPMSAFEWGRLALDSQSDPRQAARAFERTLELATASSLIEDALARLTEAYARFDPASCRRVQADYLARFPNGSHVRAVTKACPN
ncbi:MAG: FecR domain-containing protein [Myxococcaceae bacterium]